MTTVRIALVGDYSAEARAHQAIPDALRLAAAAADVECVFEWKHSTSLTSDRSLFDAFAGLWCVPGSPYANPRGVIEAIRQARESSVPFLGTCGGFQHALLEYAEAVWKIERPAHAEEDPGAIDPVISPLACSLVEQSGEVFF